MKRSHILAAVMSLVFFAAPAWAAEPQVYHGTIEGANYVIHVPTNWNGTLLLYSHGYASRFQPKAPAYDAADQTTATWLLDHGYALAASSYSAQGWAVEQALHDQTALLDQFPKIAGATPKHVVLWGHSMGGLITAALAERYPNRFAGALPMCGVVEGAQPFFDQSLDPTFALHALLGTPLVAEDAREAAKTAGDLLDAAQATAIGRARIALVASFENLPGWIGSSAPEPAATDFAAREAAQYQWLKRLAVSRFGYDAQAELRERAHGNPATNVGVSYLSEFEAAPLRDEVTALYAAAAQDVKNDLRTLDAASRISANPASADYVAANATITGKVTIPVLTLHTTGDPLVNVNNENRYAAAITANGKGALLRETFVHRAGHCAFTSAETITAVQTLLRRIDTGSWPDTSPETLNTAARALGPDANALAGDQPVPTSPAFLQYEPPAPVRTSSART
jgi:pimeloyl-ACP methyl ester carboxylesterase